MSKKNTYVVVAVALCAILAAGGILASNMGFKLNYPLNKTGTAGSKSGTNSLALPYFRQTGLNDAQQLIQDMEGSGPPFSKVLSVSRFAETTDSLVTYTGRMGSPTTVPFALTAGEGYRVQMSADLNYIVVGSHDPSLSVSLDATGSGGSKSGTNDYAAPYNITSATAIDLIKDIEGVTAPPFSKVLSVSKFLGTTDSLQTYTGRMGSPTTVPFNLVPGESYRIQMGVTVPYIASHY